MLFKTVCLCPRPSSQDDVPPEHPSPLPEEEAVKIKTLILDTIGAPLCQFNIERVLKAIVDFRNIECLVVECGLFNSRGVDTVLDRIGNLPTNPFPKLRYLELMNMWPTRLRHHTEDLEHLFIRYIPMRREKSTNKLLVEDYRNLTMLTLDGQSLLGLLRWEDGRRLCSGIQNMRILWDQNHLMDWGMSRKYVLLENSDGSRPTGWNIEMKMEPIILSEVRHLHMDIVRELLWGDVGDVKFALRNALEICKRISMQVEELIIFVSEEALDNEVNHFELARCLPRTFRSQASMDQLRGVAVFLEVRDKAAVEEFQRGFEDDTKLSLSVLERDPSDVTRSSSTREFYERPTHTTRTTTIVVTEGEAIECSCKGREIIQRRYVNRFLGENRLSCREIRHH